MLQRQSRIKDPLWYKDAIIYEVRIRSFFDSNADGIGDLPGITQKLEYIQDLGVDTLWVLPFYPSPLKDDGYDIADYLNVNPQYGTLADFKHFINRAHECGLNVITEVVLNHTSNQHAWFQRARKAEPDSVWRDFYVWSQNPDKYREARIIFQDFERSNWTWDHEAKAYYWHRFYSNQPDLNYDCPAVRQAVLEVLDFWLEMGVDGFRLDAIPYLFEREGTNCENLPETHEFVKQLRSHVDSKFSHRMILGEANQWPADAAAYFGKGDECHMAFHFPLMPRLFMAIQLEDRFPLIDILQQTPPIPDNAQWTLFLRNHDELTLEMVTDEERDYMYHTYAQDPQARLNLGIRRRLAPLLGNDRRKIELMNGILFSFPGTPIIYYADEIGMGDNIYLGDRDGVRTPMQWSPDSNAGFSKANPQRLCLPVTMDPEYSYGTINIENQKKNSNSLLWWMKRLIALRKRFKAFGRGSIEFLNPSNYKILAFIRRHQDEIILVVANFSRFIQYVELSLSNFKELIPYELFGRTRFPAIGELPYLLTLGPYAFYWFSLQSEQQPDLFSSIKIDDLPAIEVQDHWSEVFHAIQKTILEKYLLLYLRRCPWFKEKDQPFKSAVIEEKITIPWGSESVYLIFLKIVSDRGLESVYAIPIAFTTHPDFPTERDQVDAQIANLHFRNRKHSVQGVLYDPFCNPVFYQNLLKGFFSHKHYKGLLGELVNIQGPNSKYLDHHNIEFASVDIKHFNRDVLTISFGQDWFLKIYRNVEIGINPEVEINRFLTKKNVSFAPSLVGVLEYEQRGKESYSFGCLQQYVVNQGTAWKYTLDEADRYFERVMTRSGQIPENEIKLPLLDKIKIGPSQDALELIGTYLDRVRMMGEITAQMHLSLADEPDDPAFKCEAPTPFYLRSNYQSKRNLVVQVCHKLESLMPGFPEHVKKWGSKILNVKESIIKSFDIILHPKELTVLIRCHGDYHLKQLLFTGKEFMIVDFEQKRDRPSEEGRRKRSALRDLSSMLRSLHFAVFTSFSQQKQKGMISAPQFPSHEQWPLFWQGWVSAEFLKAYLAKTGSASFIQHDLVNFILNLNAYLLEGAIKDLANELNQQNFDWLIISMQWIFFIQDRYEKNLSVQNDSGDDGEAHDR